MFPVQDYRAMAKENETVFRNILRDMIENSRQRPNGVYFPNGVNPNASIDDIFREHSAGIRYGRPTILDFEKPEQHLARFSFEDVAVLSGGGAILDYLVKPDDAVEFKEAHMVWRS